MAGFEEGFGELLGGGDSLEKTSGTFELVHSSEGAVLEDGAVDVTAPETPGVVDMIAASDSGRFSSDNITNVAAPTFTGNTEPYALVTVFIDGVAVGEAKANAAGDWSYTASKLSDGAHSVSVTSADAYGNTSDPSAPLQVVIDTQAPSAPSQLSIDSDSGSDATDGLTSDATPVANGVAEPNSLVTITDENGVVVGTTTAGSDGSWSLSLLGAGQTALEDGSHSFAVTATDLAGNFSESTALDLIIDTKAPSDGVLEVSEGAGGYLNIKEVSDCVQAIQSRRNRP
ncbi:Ig-like domain-containing protein [Halodesulfovibrio marinisediminis]|uniref:Bacterial Ig-like domain-containing protein n=1 Tax=Halodesulfovibrio marinisediminis DSM 17456 TaxID=1121457 RepID=A0A1N6IG57_9BACT|nr:Ig-like domain-containing protein [Halodesulfovibrio marinisediminis]SIO31007.1 hypothetical protein SAMN02745161_2721 [Halodesulfovibrio marinisediminis DSM 17456]